MNGKCPHGHPRPPSAAYIRVMSNAPLRDDRKVVVISDSRECPPCLQAQVAEANTILNKIFSRPGSIDADVLRLWADYVVRYNP